MLSPNVPPAEQENVLSFHRRRRLLLLLIRHSFNSKVARCLIITKRRRVRVTQDDMQIIAVEATILMIKFNTLRLRLPST